MNRKREERLPPPHREMVEKVASKAERRIKARAERHRSVWFGLGMFGLIGWAIAIPTLIGIAIGVWLDARWPSQVSWTLTLLGVGLVLGCLHAWFWAKREISDG